MMLALALSALLAAAPLPPASLEQQASLYVLREFERVGRRAPQADPALGAAARRLAQEALRDSPSGAVELLALTEAVSDAGGADPSPRSYVVRAWEREHALWTLQGRKDLNQEPTSHMGVGAAVDGARAAIVVLLADRKATLQRFPRTLEKAGTTQSLCGELLPPLRQPELYVTQPDGRVERFPLTREAGSSFCSRLVFPAVGRYTVELIGRSERGPEVAALFLVDAGGRQRGQREHQVEPTTVDEARQALLARINALRHAHGLQPLQLDDALGAVAQAYSERMAREGFFAHVAPDGSDLRRRLTEAGISYRTAGENLGLASGPLAAHFGIEHSPGHRSNLLGPHFTRAGIGVAFQKVDGRDQALVTEILSTGAPLAAPEVDPLTEAYRTLSSHRAARGLPPLQRNPVLEQIALDHARRALALDQPRVQLSGSKVHDRVFQALEGPRALRWTSTSSKTPRSSPTRAAWETARTPTSAWASSAVTRAPTARGCTGSSSSTPGSAERGPRPRPGAPLRSPTAPGSSDGSPLGRVLLDAHLRRRHLLVQLALHAGEGLPATPHRLVQAVVVVAAVEVAMSLDPGPLRASLGVDGLR
jgi:uncharacterized protein YkwD